MTRLGAIIAGVQKAGTSSLFGYLAQHPDLAAPRCKELHYFDDEGIDWSAPGHDRLHAHFPAADERLRFEATPIYSFWPDALARIRHYNPDIRLILIFRDPIARAWSHWRMERQRGDETRSFSDAIRATPSDEAGWRHHSYVARGFYGEQLQRALALFARAQLLLLRDTDLAQDHAAVLERVAGFLGIGAFPGLAPRRDNEGAPMGEMPAGDRDYLREVYREDTALFAALSGLDVGDWLAAEAA